MSAREKAAGRRYANEQLTGSYFQDWMREQLLEASQMDPKDVIPLETKSDARKVARNMLQQLEWDTRRDLNESADFFKGFSAELRKATTVDWLADEVLYLWREIQGEGGGVERHSRKAGESRRRQPKSSPQRSARDTLARMHAYAKDLADSRGISYEDAVLRMITQPETHAKALGVSPAFVKVWAQQDREQSRRLGILREEQRQPLPPSRSTPIRAIPKYDFGDPNANYAIEVIGGTGKRGWRFWEGYFATKEDAIAMTEHLIQSGRHQAVRVSDTRQGFKPVWEWPERTRWSSLWREAGEARESDERRSLAVGDRVRVVKGCKPCGLDKGVTAAVKSIQPLGADYGHSVKVVLEPLNGFKAGKSLGFYARHLNRLSDPIVRMNDGNPSHTIEVQLRQ